MYIIRDPIDLHAVSHSSIAQILTQRISELKLSPEVGLLDIGEFIIVEPGDNIYDLEEASIATDLFSEVHFGNSDFVQGAFPPLDMNRSNPIPR